MYDIVRGRRGGRGESFRVLVFDGGGGEVVVEEGGEKRWEFSWRVRRSARI
jgi:hypothetical protein